MGIRNHFRLFYTFLIRFAMPQLRQCPEKQRERGEQEKRSPARFRRNIDPRAHKRQRTGKSRDRRGRVSHSGAEKQRRNEVQRP